MRTLGYLVINDILAGACLVVCLVDCRLMGFSAQALKMAACR